jgi:hypothetical protein
MPTLKLNIKTWIAILFIPFLGLSCKKMLEVKSPVDQLTNDKVFITDNSTMSALLSVYNQLSVTTSMESNITTNMGAYADELNPGFSALSYLNNAVPPNDDDLQLLWTGLYNAVYQSNALIETMNTNTSLSDSTRREVIGEAKFLRAFSYFYLVNTWGNVPLITSTNANNAALAKQETTANVYTQVVTDLLDAQKLLPESFIYPERVRASKMAASALLARVYLYQQQWAAAITQSTSVIQLSDKIKLDSLNNVFVKNSHETILQFWRQNGFAITGLFFIPDQGDEPDFPVTDFLLNAFVQGDMRKTSWLDSTIVGGFTFYFPYKYKKRGSTSGSDGEYSMVLRLGEQYLNRAEAFINTNNLPAAVADINTIRARAGLPAISNAYSQSQLLSIIQKERWNELFTEWGHRFFDLKRWGQLDAVLASRKPLWKLSAALLPIPQQEINRNPFLVQNPGY